MLCSRFAAPSVPLAGCSRSYAISVHPGKVLPGKKLPRVFKDKKAFQYHWYKRLLDSTSTSPLIILHRDAFTAQRLKKLRLDIQTAVNKLQAKQATESDADAPQAPSLPPPTLTVIRSSIFGAALRDFPDVNAEQVDEMTKDVKGGYAVLSLPILDPPTLSAVLKALDRSVPPRPAKTQAELDKEEQEKNADPATPGRRMKRVRQVLTPDLKVLGALIEGKVLLPQRIQDVSQLPTLETLRAQIVGLVSAPASQLAGVLGQAGGGRLARTLEGFRKALEEAEAPVVETSEGQSTPPPQS